MMIPLLSRCVAAMGICLNARGDPMPSCCAAAMGSEGEANVNSTLQALDMSAPVVHLQQVRGHQGC